MIKWKNLYKVFSKGRNRRRLIVVLKKLRPLILSIFKKKSAYARIKWNKKFFREHKKFKKAILHNYINFKQKLKKKNVFIKLISKFLFCKNLRLTNNNIILLKKKFLTYYAKKKNSAWNKIQYFNFFVLFKKKLLIYKFFFKPERWLRDRSVKGVNRGNYWDLRMAFWEWKNLDFFLKSKYLLEVFDNLIKKNVYNKTYYQKYFFFFKIY